MPNLQTQDANPPLLLEVPRMIDIVLTVVGFALLKGVFLVLFAREHCQIDPTSQSDASSAALHIDRDSPNGADYNAIIGRDVPA